MRALSLLCISDLYNPIPIQPEDRLDAFLLRVRQEKPEDSPFCVKQRYNVQPTSEEANLSSSHCFEKCLL
jgi:hypothetical protein